MQSIAAPPTQPRAQTTQTAQDIARAFGVAVRPLFDITEANVGRFLDTPPKPRIWLLKDYLPAGVVGSVVASGGTGKSQLILQLIASVAAGVTFCGAWDPSEPGEALALLAEDDEEEIHRRMSHIARYMRETHKSRDIDTTLRKNLYVRSVVAENNLLTSVGATRGVHDTGYADRIIATVARLKNLKLIVLDPASRFRGGDESSADEVTRFIEILERIRKATNATVIIVHHVTKASMRGGEQTQDASRGSSAFSDGIRWQMNLATLTEAEAKSFSIPTDDRRHYLSATMTKNNYAPPQPTVYLKRSDGGVLLPAMFSAAKKDDRILRIVAKVACISPISADQFEREYGGKGNIFEIGQQGLRGCIKQAIEQGYLTRPDTGLERPLRGHREITCTNLHS